MYLIYFFKRRSELPSDKQVTSLSYRQDVLTEDALCERMNP